MRPTHLRRPLALLLVTLAGGAAAVGCSGGDPNPGVPQDINIATVMPPPITGGTLAISSDGKTAVAADPDRDMVWIVDLETKALESSIALEAGDEPGRVALDDAGRAHVVLRGGGAVATIDVAQGKVLERRDVCAQPRGVAYEAAGEKIHVACATGELVTFPAAGGAATRKLKLDNDLRDVVVQGDKLLVSRFRSTEILVIGVDGKVWQRETPRASDSIDPLTGLPQSFEPSVAWRMVQRPVGGAIMVHQRSKHGPVIVNQPGGYGSGGGCDGSIVETTVTEVESGGEAVPIVIPPIAGNSVMGSALPVDIAVSSGGSELVVVSAGTNSIFRTSPVQIHSDVVPGCDGTFGEPLPGQPTAAAFFGQDTLAVQLREPAMIVIIKPNETPMNALRIELPGESRADTGHDLFHKSPTGTGSIACASCHPEGDDDHRVWHFDPIGPRRTQSIRGGILATAPLHWDGDLEDIGHLMGEVFVNRMGGMDPGPRHARLLGRWVDGLKLKPKAEVADTSAVERGKILYTDAKVGCASCHGGDKLTNNQSLDVGTGKRFQVPTLMGIAEHAPYMHDGCAPTLRDRFTNPTCGGGDKHGVTSHLTEAQIDDLVAYLETL